MLSLWILSLDCNHFIFVKTRLNGYTLTNGMWRRAFTYPVLFCFVNRYLVNKYHTVRLQISTLLYNVDDFYCCMRSLGNYAIKNAYVRIKLLYDDPVNTSLLFKLMTKWMRALRKASQIFENYRIYRSRLEEVACILLISVLSCFKIW